MYRTIQGGADILLALVPKLTASVLPHAQMIGVVDVLAPADPEAMFRTEIFESASTDTIPGTVFLSPNSLANSWRAAEALLHEAAHNKLFELIMSCSILREGYAQKESEVSVLAFWNKENPSNPRDWSVDRALLACHVYVYLALFFAIIERNVKHDDVRIATGGAIDASRTAGTSFARASYLEEQLRQRAWGEMGENGHELMDWMRGRLEQLRAYISCDARAKVTN
jgi:HEXXH motif-containing protein